MNQQNQQYHPTLADILGSELPNDIAAEQAVLGSVLIDPQLMDMLQERLTPASFYATKHQKIFRRMMDLAVEGDPIDVLTLVAKLVEHDEAAIAGGVSYLTRLASSVPTTANTEHYAGIVLEKYLLRQSIEASMALIQQAATSGDPGKIITGLQDTATRLGDMAAPKKDFTRLRDVLMDVYEEAEERYENRNEDRGITGLPTGFDDLDRMTAGFQKSDLIIVAARPSVGKTAFALNIAQNVGVKTKETVAVFSLEMSDKQLAKRLLCSESRVDASRMRTGYFEDGDWEKMTNGISHLAESNVFLDDTPGLNVYEIRAKCRRLKKEHGLGMIIIDYLQLIAGRGRGDNRQQEVSEISRMLKQLARELDVPVIALSQLSRGVEQRQDKRPMMSDLRESGSIEQDADIVAFLYRDDYYDKESEKKNIIEIIIAKQRNGPVGTVELVFLKQFNKFVNLTRANEQQKRGA
ncbi:replicative DNA helicase [Paenibacillus alvei]|uniref:replicative DNA helicase n=1 Tax=Paenibacillus alvei TaxID=44250 RepID=UPI00227FDB40|nr:replicative DNA helicase [Paenibacillus alvei]MCY9541828.1 replicative DNA helicase [Paenibacillus alvei]MCY9704983.1 replicative DNA helicase [Paenibacillus alvei]MCY9755320.1 replicative DNA helicase [Paenibacillus alvei]MEC0082475.1 replicative DNA helicase [Paenibacillus alvei]